MHRTTCTHPVGVPPAAHHHRQFRKEEHKARLRGDYQPPGLLAVAQFRHAWKKFSVRVSEEQAHALFIKYGCDTQGLLPYDLFATKLLTSSMRMLALEPEQKVRPGAWPTLRAQRAGTCPACCACPLKHLHVGVQTHTDTHVWVRIL